MKKINGIRGAVCSKNTEEEITKNVCELCDKIFTENKINSTDIVSIQFSITKKITKLNPASALRKGKLSIDVSEIALFCTQEAEIEGMLENVIRVLVTAYVEENSVKKNIYLNGAEKLRPDFAEKK